MTFVLAPNVYELLEASVCWRADWEASKWTLERNYSCPEKVWSTIDTSRTWTTSKYKLLEVARTSGDPILRNSYTSTPQTHPEQSLPFSNHPVDLKIFIVNMPFITTKDNVQIYYKDWGSPTGPIVVLSHGWPLNSDNWENQMFFRECS
jgi:hypothetical protein